MGLSTEGHTNGLGGSFVPLPFFWNEWHEETFPGESGGSVAPLPPNVGIHPGTYQHPYDDPSLGLTNVPYLPTPWQQGFYFSYLHNAALADCYS